ncbi:hypothetical protein ElyMa_000097400 [Elysia marginata]|uniref:Uncharacterized protein n=1 Tax=Elysia marginata TaxID=1093978 RepID=A0AAV4ELQ2_9GAST|nr:hypothetical protein ElyMa_000097400 [Elysia marginata]
MACSWVPILQMGGLRKVRVNCFPKAAATWHGRESNPRPPDRESDALTTLPRCPWQRCVVVVVVVVVVVLVVVLVVVMIET